MKLHNVFADAGVPGALIPIASGLCVAGLFLAAAAVFGGLWLVHGSAAPTARKRFLIATAIGCLGAAVPVAFLGTPKWFEYWIATVVLAVVGLVALLKLRSSAPFPPQDPDNPIY